jgi:REP element-mobilizing transposase RayT
MPQSLAAIYLHAIFSTKNRSSFLSDEGFRRELFAYTAEVSNRLECPAIEVGGVADHLHILARFGRGITVSDWMREVKRISSTFVKTRDPEFSWQAGYGVFSVSAPHVEIVRAYIVGQEEHHRTVSFQDELRRIMTEHGVVWDEKYFWD